jgi:integrase
MDLGRRGYLRLEDSQPPREREGEAGQAEGPLGSGARLPHERASRLHPLRHRDKDRLLFTWPTGKAGQVQRTMERACKAAGIAHYHPHDLRHRRVSLWHKQGQSWAEIGAKVGATPKVLADTYTHVLVGAEVPDEALGALLVWSRCGLEAQWAEKHLQRGG